MQGGMGVGISLSTLAGTVSKEGGIGVISAAQIGYSEPEYKLSPLETNLKMLREHIRRARAIAPDGILGVNIMVATKEYARYVVESVKAGIDIIISGAGLPLELPSLTKGSKTMLAPIVSSVKAAQIIFKMWDKKHKACPDLVVIEGPEAGGHLGFHEEDIEYYKENSYAEEVKGIITVIKEYAEKYQKKIPIFLGGGISDSTDVENSMSLGVDGVQVGSLFVTTKECDAHEAYKEAYVDCTKEDIVIIKSPVGLPGRAVKNNFLERIKEGRVPTTGCKRCISSCNPMETKYCIADALIRAVNGDTKEGLIFCGAKTYLQKEITTVKEVLNSLCPKVKETTNHATGC